MVVSDDDDDDGGIVSTTRRADPTPQFWHASQPGCFGDSPGWNTLHAPRPALTAHLGCPWPFAVPLGAQTCMSAPATPAAPAAAPKSHTGAVSPPRSPLGSFLGVECRRTNVSAPAKTATKKSIKAADEDHGSAAVPAEKRAKLEPITQQPASESDSDASLPDITRTKSESAAAVLAQTQRKLDAEVRPQEQHTRSADSPDTLRAKQKVDPVAAAMTASAKKSKRPKHETLFRRLLEHQRTSTDANGVTKTQLDELVKSDGLKKISDALARMAKMQKDDPNGVQCKQYPNHRWVRSQEKPCKYTVVEVGDLKRKSSASPPHVSSKKPKSVSCKQLDVADPPIAQQLGLEKDGDADADAAAEKLRLAQETPVSEEANAAAAATERELKRQAADDPPPIEDLDIADEEDATDEELEEQANEQNQSPKEVVEEHLSNQLKSVTLAKEPATPAWTPPALSEQDDEDTEVVYPTQKQRAVELFDMMKQQLGGNLNEFKKFELRIQVPNLNTLHDQTVDRLKKYICHHRKTVAGFFGRHVDVSVDEAGEGTEECLTGGLVQKNNNSREQQAKRKKLIEDIQNHQDTLFLVVHDEAHYEATEGGAAHKLINDDILRNAPNVVTLFVSATPYNLVTEDSQVPEANVVFWETNGDGGGSQAPRYFGLPHYEDNLVDADALQDMIPQGSLCACDAKFNAAVKEMETKLRVDGKFNGKNQKANIAQAALLNTVISEYVGALNQVKRVESIAGDRWMFPTTIDISDSLTKRMVRDLVNESVTSRDDDGDGGGIMIMLRQPASTGRQIFNAIKGTRDKLKLHGRFAVLIDLDSKGPGGLRRCMKGNVEMYDAMKKANSGNEPTMEQYSDLEGVPCILILCEKGKMGKLIVWTVNLPSLSQLQHMRPYWRLQL